MSKINEEYLYNLNWKQIFNADIDNTIFMASDNKCIYKLIKSYRMEKFMVGYYKFLFFKFKKYDYADNYLYFLKITNKEMTSGYQYKIKKEFLKKVISKSSDEFNNHILMNLDIKSIIDIN